MGTWQTPESRPEWLLGGNPGAIENQEAAGQSALLNADVLPADGSSLLPEVRWGDVLPQDPLFREAHLPDGWLKRATDHTMWSEIVDDHGQVRAKIFYKAAFYDQDAFLNLSKAFIERYVETGEES